MQRILTLAAIGAAGPAAAATKNVLSGEFYSLANTDFIVLVAFLIFVGVLLYYSVPTLLAGLLDKRAVTIRAELDEARALREEARTLLASYERKQREVKDQADRIVAAAREGAAEAAAQAEKALATSIERRLQAAADQIASAEANAVRQVRDEAARIATAAAGEVIAREMSASRSGQLIDDAIATVRAKLH